MLGVHATGDALVLSDGQRTGPDENWIEWILATETKQDKIAYDIDYLAAQLLRHSFAEERECRRLLTEHRAHLRSGHSIFYIPNRVMSIEHGYQSAKRYTTIYNAKQYATAQHNPSLTIDEARRLAATALATGQSVHEGYDALGIDGRSLTSPVKAFDKAGLWPNIATVDDIPTGAGELAYQTIKSNWVEAFALGHWDNVYDYDINGAYASEMALLQEIRNGQWVEADKVPHGAVYGFSKGLLEIHVPFHPILMRGDRDSLYTPVGIWETYLTQQEIGFITRNQLGFYRIHEGWWWIPEHTSYPFHATVMRIWQARQKNEGMVSTICKRILAGMWGKMLEMRGSAAEPEFGPHFNPVYGAIVEANIRLRVAQVCLENGITPLHVAVDGMITDRKLENVIVNSNLGGWRLSSMGPCLIAGSGVVGMKGNEGEGEFSLSYDWLKGMMEVYPAQAEYEKKKWGCITVNRALNEGKWDRLGELEEVTKTVSVGGEVKRFYERQPKCGKDVLTKKYTSLPWSTSVVGLK
jgi:hypothetical protein